MQFLKTLFWVLLAVILVLFATRNWTSVTLNLWGDIQADINLPLLLTATFLLGFLPTWLVMRARVWAAERRIEALDRQRLQPAPPTADQGPPPMDPGAAI